MAPLSPRRKKLGHDSAVAIPATVDGGVEDGDAAESSSEESTTNDAPVTKQKPSRSQGADDSALYSGGVYKSSMFKLQV
jgi:U3 small nucleolar RNA-associated protein 22